MEIIVVVPKPTVLFSMSTDPVKVTNPTGCVPTPDKLVLKDCLINLTS